MPSACFESASSVKLEEMEASIPFKNLHNREYQGHKKKVRSLCVCLCVYVLVSMRNPRVIDGFLVC
jgi:hypothetical protein